MQDASVYARYPAAADVPPNRGAEWAPRAFWLAMSAVEAAMQAPTATAAEAVDVAGNHGRWVVGCPDCSSAQLACRTDARFMCHECGNVAIAGQWRPVVWPKAAAAIAAELDTRPRAANRNWLPGETVGDLVAEKLAAEEVERKAKRDRATPAPSWEGHTHTWAPADVEDRFYCTECDDTASLIEFTVAELAVFAPEDVAKLKMILQERKGIR